MARKTKTQKNFLVFISHSEKDRWIAKQISRLIEDRGRAYRVKTFLDEKDIQAGESIAESIRKNIQDCDEFIVLLTRYSVVRPWVLIEIGAAWGLQKRIVTIIDKVSPDEMPDITTPFKAIDLNNFDEYLEELLKRAKGARK